MHLALSQFAKFFCTQKDRPAVAVWPCFAYRTPSGFQPKARAVCIQLRGTLLRDIASRVLVQAYPQTAEPLAQILAPQSDGKGAYTRSKGIRHLGFRHMGRVPLAPSTDNLWISRFTPLKKNHIA